MQLAVGAKGFDSASSIDPVEAHKQGGLFQLRYSAGEGSYGNPRSAGKLTKQHEIDSILKAGSFFGANSEWYETRCTEGKSAGRSDGENDRHFWQSRGYDKGCSIYFSWDADPGITHYPAVVKYIEGYREGLQGFYTLDGMYAGMHALDFFARHAGIRHGWIPSAASWSGSNHGIDRNIAPPARSFWDLWEPTNTQIKGAIEFLQNAIKDFKLDTCLWQCGNYAFGKEADVNYVVKAGNFGFMAPKVQHTTPATPPRPTHVTPAPAKPPVVQHPSPAPVKHEDPKPAPANPKLYTVKEGDTLWGIASKHNTTWQKLQRLNRITNPNDIRPGQELHLP